MGMLSLIWKPDWYRFEFDEHAMRIVTGATAPADIVNRIAASALAGCMAHEKSFFYVRAYSRRSLAARETSAKSAALRSLTQIIFGIRRKRWLRLDGRRSI